MTHRRRPIRRLQLFSTAVAGALILIATQVTTAGASATQVLRISARPHTVMRFTVNRLHAHRGRVTILMSNPSNSGMRHGIAIVGRGVGPIVGPGHSSSVSANFTPGSYTYYCPVPGHRAAGMKGVLVVS